MALPQKTGEACVRREREHTSCRDFLEGQEVEDEPVPVGAGQMALVVSDKGVQADPQINK